MLHSLLRIIVGLFFIFSGISKLFPIEPFEATLVNFGITNWFFVPFLARIIIGIELFIGLCITFNCWLKKIVYLLTQSLLVFFILYLAFILFTEGNASDCGCFGNWINLSPLSSIIKNIVLIVLLVFIKKPSYFWGWKFLPVLFIILAFTVPFLTNKVGLQNIQSKPLNHKIDWSELPNTYLTNKKINVDEGNKIIVFLSATCMHCESAAYKLGTLNKKNDSSNVIIVIATKKEETLNKLITKTSLNYPIIWMTDNAFFKYSGGTLPAIYYIENGVIKKRWTGKYFNIEELTSFIEKM